MLNTTENTKYQTSGLGKLCNFINNVVLYRVKYTDGPCGLPKFWIWSLAFQKYMDGPCGLHFVTHLVPNIFQMYMNGPYGLHFLTHLVPNFNMLKRVDLLARD
ncbi:hypothetical protein Hanom_Chr02g00174681 [Helianthus anomalus]